MRPKLEIVVMSFWGSSILGLKVTRLLQSAPHRHLTCKPFWLACLSTSIKVPSHQHPHLGSPQKSVFCNAFSLLTWFISLLCLLTLPNTVDNITNTIKSCFILVLWIGWVQPLHTNTSCHLFVNKPYFLLFFFQLLRPSLLFPFFKFPSCYFVL